MGEAEEESNREGITGSKCFEGKMWQTGRESLAGREKEVNTDEKGGRTTSTMLFDEASRNQIILYLPKIIQYILNILCVLAIKHFKFMDSNREIFKWYCRTKFREILK